MNKSLVFGTSLSAMVLSACVPMEQATLTYTSKSTVGVGIEAGTAQTPGLDISLGYREMNLALVPVAVAKFCYKARGEACQNAIYEMELIEGGKSDETENSPVQMQIQENNSRLALLNQQQALGTDELAKLRANIAVAESAERAKSELIGLAPATGSETEAQSNARAALVARSQSAPDNFDLAAARTKLALLDAARIDRTARIETFTKHRTSLADQLESNNLSGRTDAFSVYGRFDGTARATAQSGSLTAGKVFATGIAAQNLTEFGTAADCLASIHSLAQLLDVATYANDRAKLLASAGEICSRD